MKSLQAIRGVCARAALPSHVGDRAGRERLGATELRQNRGRQVDLHPPPRPPARTGPTPQPPNLNEIGRALVMLLDLL